MLNVKFSSLVGALVMAAFLAITSQANSESSTADNLPQKKSDNFAEYNAIRKALKPYIESAKTGDGKLTRTAFYDHAHIVGSVGGTFYNLNADAFGDAVAAGGKSPEIEHQITWIDISGPAAAAKVEFKNWGGNRFTDFFVLYKHGGTWKISGKVYDSHSGN